MFQKKSTEQDEELNGTTERQPMHADAVALVQEFRKMNVGDLV